MRKTLLVPLLAIALAACASYDDLPPEPYIEPARERDRVDRPRREASSSDLGLPAAWWRDPGLAEPLALSSEQFQRLDALRAKQDEIDRLEDDVATALRDLRGALRSKSATAPEILAAGNHLRELRDALLGRQIALLASQREILTQPQWEALQEALAEEWRERRPERRPRIGGRGGFGGRRPGGVW